MIDLSAARWIKSSRSSSTGQCIEVAAILPGVAVRDSKNPGGPALLLDPAAFAAFTSAVKTGHLEG